MSRDNKKEFVAAAYVRLSKKRLIEYANIIPEKDIGVYSDSINNQKLIINEFINQKEDNITLHKFYIDDGFTGLNFERPAFTKMMEDIRNGIVNLVIVKDTSRLGREFILTNNLIQRVFPSLSVRYVSIIDDYDSFKDTTREDILMLKSLFNESYAKDISNKVKGSFKSKIAARQYIGAFAPYGYKKHKDNKNLLVIDEDAAPVIKTIFNMYISGNSKQAIARYLTQKGIPTPHLHKENQGLNYKNWNCSNSGLWSYSTIDSILKNRVYLGDLVQHKTMSNFRLRKRIKVSPDSYIISEATHLPIIDEETFEKAQELLKQRARTMATSPTGEVSLFSGKIFCGDCHRSLSRTRCGNKGLDKEVYYKCSTYKYQGSSYCSTHSIRLDVLTDIVLRVTKAKVQSVLNQKEENNISYIIISRLEDRQKNIKKDISKLETFIDTLANKQKKLFMSYVDDNITKEQFTDYNVSISNKIKESQNALNKLKTYIADEKRVLMDFDTWYNHYVKFINIEKLNRSIINELINRIDVYDTGHGLNINVCFKFANPLEYQGNDSAEDIKISKSLLDDGFTYGRYNNITVSISETKDMDISNTITTNNNNNETDIYNYYSSVVKNIKLPALTSEATEILGSTLVE